MKFEWNALDSKHNDIFIANKGSYLLRCDQISEKSWWWAVYFNNLEIDGSNRDTIVNETSASAKEMAEFSVKMHWSSRLALQKIENINRSLVLSHWKFDQINALWNECIATAISKTKRKK